MTRNEKLKLFTGLYLATNWPRVFRLMPASWKAWVIWQLTIMVYQAGIKKQSNGTLRRTLDSHLS